MSTTPRAGAPRSPLVTVVIPAHNVEAYLRESSGSVLEQSFTDFELLIVNDGSTDRTLDVARAIEREDDRVRVIDRQNGGLSVARNTGTAQARGRYLLFLDADDALLPRAVEALVNSLESSGSDFAVGSYVRWNGPSRRVPDWIAELHAVPARRTTVDRRPDLTANVIAVSKLYRRAFLLENDIWFAPGILYEDQQFAALAYSMAASIDILDEEIYLWRVREDLSSISQQIQNVTNSSALMQAVAHAIAIYREYGHPGAARRRLEHMIAVDLPPLASAAANGSAEHRTEFARIAGPVLRTADVESWTSAPLVRRLRVHHAFRGRWNDLLAFDELLRTQGEVLPVDINTEGEARLAPHVFAQEDWASVPGWLRVCAEEDARATVYVREARVNGTDVVLSGCIFVRGMTSSPDDVVTATLVHTSGARRELEISKYTDPDFNRWAAHRVADYRSAGFSVTISLLEALSENSAGAWHLEVSLARRGFTATSRVTHVNRGRTAGWLLSPHLVIGGVAGTAVIGVNKSAGFTLGFRRDEVRATALTADASRSRLRLVVESRHALRSAALRDRTRPQVVKRARARQIGDDTYVVTFTLPSSAPETTWELTTVDREGRNRLVSWVRDDSPPPAVDFGWAPTPRRYVEARTFRDLVFVESLSVDSHGAQVEVSGASLTRAQAASLRLVSVRAASSASTVEERSHGGFRVTIPWSYETFGFPHRVLPSGVYSLEWTPDLDGPRRRQVRLPVHAIKATPRTHLVEDLVLADAWRLPATGALRLTLSAPLAPEERGQNGQARLSEDYRRRDYVARAAVFFQCYRGDLVGDSQLALHRELRSGGCDRDLIWGVADRSIDPPEGGTAVVIGTRAWYDAVGSATHLCNNIDFDRFFVRRTHQTVVSTFHGHPFKAMGRLMWETERVPEYRLQAELTRRQREWSIAVVPSDEAGLMYREQYEYEGTLAVSGYPRNDRLARPSRHEREEVLARLGVDPGQHVVLYAPTWRETLATSMWTAALFDALDLSALARSLGEDYAVLLRGHGHNARGGVTRDSAAVIDVTHYPSIEDLIVAADVAVLDYSSLRFDWAVTEKPAVFFVPDKEAYFARRPTLLPWDETRPGPEVTTQSEVVGLLRDLEGLHRSTIDEIRSFNARFNALSDGHASERLIELVSRVSGFERAGDVGRSAERP